MSGGGDGGGDGNVVQATMGVIGWMDAWNASNIVIALMRHSPTTSVSVSKQHPAYQVHVRHWASYRHINIQTAFSLARHLMMRMNM